MDDINFSYPHDMDPDIFREALSYSEGLTGFTASLIEKDYYCSLILRHIFNHETSLVFKGGTCLSKVYADFYRLSEDLDFMIPVAVTTQRKKRRSEMELMKEIFSEISTEIPGITILQPFKGHNESRQYISYLEYQSMVMEKQERIKIEIGIREPLLLPSVIGKTRTIVVNPFSRRPVLPVFSVKAIDMKEAYAEKVRAALTRKEPAIRDLFDLIYAVNKMNLDLYTPDFIDMVRKKLDVPGNILSDIFLEYKRVLIRQIEGQLRPVLRPVDFDSFDLDEAFNMIVKIVKTL